MPPARRPNTTVLQVAGEGLDIRNFKGTTSYQKMYHLHTPKMTDASPRQHGGVDPTESPREKTGRQTRR